MSYQSATATIASDNQEVTTNNSNSSNNGENSREEKAAPESGLWIRAAKAVIYAGKGLSQAAKVLFIILRDYQGDNYWAFPSLDTLAADMECSKRYVQQLITELEIAGAIEIKERHGHSYLYHSRYEERNPQPKENDATVAPTAPPTRNQKSQGRGRTTSRSSSPVNHSSTPPMNYSSTKLESVKLESNTVCKGTVNLAQSEQLRSGNQNSQYQQPPTFKLIDSQKSNYQKVSPFVKEVLSDEQREIATLLHGAGVATEDAERIALTNLSKNYVQEWIKHAEKKANPGGYLVVVLGKKDATPPPEHHSRNQERDDKGHFQRKGGEAGNAKASAAPFTTDKPIDFTKYADGGKYGYLVSVKAEANDESLPEGEAQTTPEDVVSSEIATVAVAKSRAAHDTPTNVIDVPQTNEPSDNAGDDFQPDDYEYDPNVPIPGLIGELSLDKLVPYRVKPAAAPVPQTEIITPVEMLDVPTQTVAEPIVATLAPVVAPQTSIGFDSESDSRLVKALQLLEADAAFVDDASITNNDRQEPTLTVSFWADQKPNVVRLEQWKHALHFHPATRTIKTIVVKELQPEPEIALTNSTAYSYNFQPKPYEQVAANGIENEAWKAPAIAKCLELLGDDADLVCDIHIGPNWINVMAVMVSFDANNQPSEQTLKDWKHKVLHGFNKELRGKEIKEVEVTLLRPTSCANADTEKAVEALEKLGLSSSDVVELEGGNNLTIDVATINNLSKVEAELPEIAPEVAAAIEREIEAALAIEASDDVGQPEFNNAPVQAGEPESRVGDSSSGDGGNGGSDQNSDATEPSADDLKELARLKELRDEAASLFNFGLAHSYPANDWLAFVGPNSKWCKYHHKLFGKWPEDDAIELKAQQWQVRFQ